jgi:hypothetical protein
MSHWAFAFSRSAGRGIRVVAKFFAAIAAQPPLRTAAHSKKIKTRADKVCFFIQVFLGGASATKEANWVANVFAHDDGLESPYLYAAFMVIRFSRHTIGEAKAIGFPEWSIAQADPYSGTAAQRE